jgi:type IV pilus assembly protein PilM
MLRIARSQVLPIGVDIGFDSVKLIQLEVVDDALAVLSAARHALPDEVRQQPSLRLPVAMDIIRRAFRTGGFHGRTVVTALPREIVHVKNLRLPQMPIAELESAVQFEARNVFPFDTEQAQVRFLHAGEVRQGSDSRQEVIVLAAKDAEVNDYLEQLHRCGAVVESLDFEPAALYRSVERFIRRRADEQDVNVLLDIGSRRAQVVIGRGREISFYKPIDIGGEQLVEAVSRKLGISPEETRVLRRRLAESGGAAASDATAKRDPVRQAVFDATRTLVEELAREIALCLRYYSVTFRGQRPAKVRFCGGEACDPHIASILNASLPVPVEPARPLLSVNTARMKLHERRGNMSEWAVALGLALKTCKQRFGARDGKKRDPNAPREEFVAKSDVAEVIDLTRAVAGAPDAAVGAKPAMPRPTAAVEEVVRA